MFWIADRTLSPFLIANMILKPMMITAMVIAVVGDLMGRALDIVEDALERRLSRSQYCQNHSRSYLPIHLKEIRFGFECDDSDIRHTSPDISDSPFLSGTRGLRRLDELQPVRPTLRGGLTGGGVAATTQDPRLGSHAGPPLEGVVVVRIHIRSGEDT